MQDRDHLIHNIFKLIITQDFSVYYYSKEGNIETSRFNDVFQQITFDNQDLNKYLNGNLYKYKKLTHVSAHEFFSLICNDFMKITNRKSVESFIGISLNDCRYILSEIELFKNKNKLEEKASNHIDNFISLFKQYIEKHPEQIRKDKEKHYYISVLSMMLLFLTLIFNIIEFIYKK